MSARRARRTRRDAAAPAGSGRAPVPPPARTGHIGPARWIVAAALFAAVLVMAVRHRVPPEARDPLAGFPLQAAADSANRRIGAGDHAGALPWLDHIERSVGTDDAAFEMQAASAAYNASFQVRGTRGFALPVTRSSIERVALVKRSLERLGNAEHAAADPAMQLQVLTARGAQLAVWGFVREAFVEYRRAASIGALSGRPLDEAAWLQGMLAEPRLDVPQPVVPVGPGGSPPRPESTPPDSAR